MQLIKGESSFLTNNHFKKLGVKLNWQDEYFAVSFVESQLGLMRGYLKKQVSHHQEKSFEEEVNEFMTKYNFQRLNH